MKLDLSHDQRQTLESALDTIQDLIDSHTERRDDLLSKYREVHGSHGLYIGEQLAEVVSIMHELMQLQFNMKQLMN